MSDQKQRTSRVAEDLRRYLEKLLREGQSIGITSVRPDGEDLAFRVPTAQHPDGEDVNVRLHLPAGEGDESLPH